MEVEMIGFDPLHLMFMIPAMLLAIWAQFKVKSAYSAAKQISAASGLTGAQTAQRILDSYGVRGVAIESVPGELSDHYDPTKKVLRLSTDIFEGRSLAALGIAAHEVGHAIQDYQHYSLLKIRNRIVPLASVGGNFSMIILVLGFMMNAFNLIALGIILFSLTVIFQLVNLPVEFDASSRAKAMLLQRGIVSPNEIKVVDKVLSAAAMTYVAATVAAVAELIYYLLRSGVLNQREE